MGFDPLSIIMGVLLASIPAALLVAVAWHRAYQTGLKEGYTKGVNQVTREQLKIALDTGRITPESYEAFCLEGWTGQLPNTTWGFIHLQAKLSGETGEFAEHFGKALRDDPGTLQKWADGFVEFTPDRRKAMLKELGDIAWYVAMLAKALGSSFLEVLAMNIVKLKDRRARGVSKGNGDDR